MKAIIVPYFTAKVQPYQKPDGSRSFVLEFGNKKMLQKYLTQFIGKTVHVSIQKPKVLRTNPQNRYLHGVVLAMIAEETGQVLEDVKVALKAKFGARKEVLGVMVPKSTAEYTKAEFIEFTEQCRVWAAEFLHMDIPLPDSTSY